MTAKIELDSFDVFGNDQSNAYFWQEYMCNLHGDACDGLCGVVLRSLYGRRLYDHTKISSMTDTRLLFNLADKAINNSPEENDSLFEILEDVLDRAQPTQSDSHITIPINDNTAYKILKDSEFGIYGNLPCEEVTDVAGHACVSLIGMLKQIFAHGIPIQFTEQTDIPGNSRIKSGRHGTRAMDRLLKFLKALNPDNLPTKYGSYILWSDEFLRTFVKQKNNNVWILTVTFPDPEGSATSKFHTYCLAIGKSSQDHQPVIDHYLKEIETLASGLDLFCPQKGK